MMMIVVRVERMMPSTPSRSLAYAEYDLLEIKSISANRKLRFFCAKNRRFERRLMLPIGEKICSTTHARASWARLGDTSLSRLGRVLSASVTSSIKAESAKISPDLAG
jgi:hypothetical protein